MLTTGLRLVLATLLALTVWSGMASISQAQVLSSSTTFIAEAPGGAPLFSFAGKRPDNLGVKNGKLAPCPATPNCVSSQCSETDREHSIAPLSYDTTAEMAIANLKAVLQSLPRTKIITEDGNYLYAEFSSALMGFVDDVEFYVDEAAQLIHVRSASRLGQSDLGVNRKRIEEIRTKLADQEAQS